MQVTIDTAFLERFGSALVGFGISETDHILLAVSGGPDSLALLLLAHQWSPERIVAATVNHKLRTESAAEAAYVSGICKNLGVRHVTLVPSEAISGNIQSSARTARYALLAEAAEAQGCSLIATAHHGDDQLETLLMRLVRGSGVNGMAGIRARNGQIIRPLLGFSKAQLEAICAAAAIDPVRDPSNDDTDFDRVVMRHWLAQGTHPFNVGAATRTASALSDAAVTLDWMAAQLAAERLDDSDGKTTFDSNGLPKEMQRRLLLLALKQIDPKIAPRGEAIERLLADLSAGRTTMIGDIACQGSDIWHFTPAPPRRTTS